MHAPGAAVRSALLTTKNPALKFRRIGLGLIRRPQKPRLATEKNLCALLPLATKNPALKYNLAGYFSLDSLSQFRFPVSIADVENEIFRRSDEDVAVACAST
jgi:hypothetical protein